MSDPNRPKRQTHSGFVAQGSATPRSVVPGRGGQVSDDLAPMVGGRAAGPAPRRGGSAADAQRVVTFSMDELDLGPQAGGAIPEAIRAGAMQTATLVPGQLDAERLMASIAAQRASLTGGGPAGGLPQLATMLHQAVPAAQEAPRHPAVERMPQEEVSVDIRDVKAEFADRRIVVLHRPDSEQAATYRVLGHRVTQGAGLRTVVISSAEPKDGKTTCAINMALALSECGRATVLLVEANLRRPSISHRMGFTPPLCFDQQLRAHRDAPMSAWTLARVTNWLHVAAVDATRFQRPKLIDALSIELAVEHFKRLPYDHIVIDTPAVLDQADVSLINGCADGIVLTAIARESSGAAVRDAIQQLAPANILGLVLLEG